MSEARSTWERAWPARPKLRSDLRSIPFRGYVIFVRYLDQNVLEIVHIIEGHRDIPALFATEKGE